MSKLLGSAVLAGALVLAGSAARAGGYPAYYGYSTYLGGPSTYFTRDGDVEQATTRRDGPDGFGTRTYYRGGPFWTYAPARHASFAPRSRRRVVLRRRG